MIYLLPHTIDNAAETAPERDAFRGHDSAINYRHLSESTNRLAHALIDQGVCRSDRVGVLMPRCTQSAIAVYGIMKAGAAYVPLDPQTPAAALRNLIQFCGIRCLICAGLPARVIEPLLLQDSCLKSVIGVPADLESSLRKVTWEDVGEFESRTPPNVMLTQQDLAYIMFTSGSTGLPKGIMHTHASGLSYAELSVATYGVQPEDRIGSHSPLHFDMSTFGYFSGPLAGATTVLIPDAHTRLPASLSQLMESERITIWYSVPFALIQLHLRGVLEDRDLTSLRWVLFGGEPFPPRHLRELMRRWPHARFSNVYGPAEVNQCTYYHLPPVEPGAPDSNTPVPIGQTWDNTEGIVVDQDDQPVSVGETGELLIRSPTMMQGYWNRADLNQIAFFRRTAHGGLDQVFYRTGDLVKLEQEGQFVFVGRKDRQVKVRGYRVELDDVEIALSAHQDVEEAAAFVVRNVGDVMQICAALTRKTSSRLTDRELLTFVSERLPWYAVPTHITFEDVFPRTSTGKIDRRQLAGRFATDMN